ncbi:hypothetical protein AGABI2DRAFT_178788, partial [Agaricus bisporus var. bisporus H97]|uniref:hypothetical protein n=1 Tax=Agaricus bisporus var. bisporus (strain H97 / ATCC MYA-4626 / FGSC 10389) TaxID=936046 RepID=UPI00029F69F9
MDLPSVARVKELTRKFVLQADEKHILHTLTPKLLRREIETELELVEGALDSSGLKDAVKEAIAETMAEVGEKADIQAASKSPGKNAGKGKKRTSDAPSKDVPKKKPRIAKKKDDKTADKTTKGKGKVSKQVASPEVVPAEDEGHKDDEIESTKKSHKKTLIEDSDDSGAEQMVKLKSDSAKPASPKVDVIMGDVIGELPKVPKEDDDKAGYKSESELSVLIDEEPPKKRRNSKPKKDNSSASSSGTKKNAKSRKTESLSKDEETIKKLKSLILACGVRKVWSKFFKGVDSPLQQIKMLKETLHELGMSGRMSLEQAKAIKAKRELAQELQDVQEFEKAVTKSKRQSVSDQESDGSEEEEEIVNPKQRRRKMNAAQSISAFLGDQSSDEN